MDNNGLSGRLRKLRKEFKLRQIDLAGLSGISHSYYNDIETRGKTPSEQVLEQLADSLRVTTAFLKGEEYESNNLKVIETIPTSTDVVLIPQIGEVRAGMLIYAQNNIDKYIKVDINSINPDKNHFYFEIVGDSMNRTIIKGDKVLVEHTSDVETGDIIISILNNNEVSIMKVRMKEDMVILLPESFNPKHIIKSYRYDEINIIGKVVKFERCFT